MRISGRTASAIARSVEANVDSGALVSGDVLPPIRLLAERLRVSPATVAGAYKLLRARGLVSGAGRGGTRVAAAAMGPDPADAAAVPRGNVDLASGHPDPLLLPPIEPALRTLRLDHGRYSGVALDKTLAAFAAAEFEADGIPGDALAVVGGALDGIERILREHVRPGDGVAVEDPCVPAVTDLIAGSGFKAIPVAVDAGGPRPEDLERALAGGARAVVITPRAQNPTGAAIDAARAADLRRVLRRYPRVVVIENDYLAPISGVPAFPLRAGSDASWAVVRSMSKFLGPDLRVALLSGDHLTVARVRRRQALGARWVSLFLQRLALALWADPACGRRLARASEIYVQRRQALQAALTSHGVPGTARAGFNLWVPVRDEAAAVAALADRGWAVAPGERFRLRSAPGIRVTTSALEPPDAARFAADLAQVLRLTRLTPA